MNSSVSVLSERFVDGSVLEHADAVNLYGAGRVGRDVCRLLTARGTRVLTVHVGRTATPRQAQIFAMEGRAYTPEKLMQPEDVAEVVLCALRLPRTAEMTTVSIRPMQKT